MVQPQQHGCYNNGGLLQQWVSEQHMTTALASHRFSNFHQNLSGASVNSYSYGALDTNYYQGGRHRFISGTTLQPQQYGYCSNGGFLQQWVSEPHMTTALASHRFSNFHQNLSAASVNSYSYFLQPQQSHFHGANNAEHFYLGTKTIVAS